MRSFLIGSLLSLSFYCLTANTSFKDSTKILNNITKRQYAATKINQSIRLDGEPNDPVWQSIKSTGDFTQFDPNPYQKASQATEIKLAYDNDAIYILAYMKDSPADIRKDLSARDQIEGNTDYITFSFDPFDDDQTGIRFIVTAAGVQGDCRIGKFESGNGNGWSNSDFSWDAVWESSVSMREDGWVAELKIPYMALRFPKKVIQTWGFQSARQIKRLGETNTWQVLDPTMDSQVIQWGDLTDLKDIKPPLRLSLSPYIAGTVQRTPFDKAGQIEYSNQNSISGGLDLKYGINESFTLDATLVPNFGQVQSDNQVLNLSAFEVKYDERRPFFTEGTDLFNKGDIFYSRRVGGTPEGYWTLPDQLHNNEIIRSNPAETQLYNAMKISGRSNKKLGIGFFNAVAAPMYATIYNEESQEERKVQTSVLTNYNVTVLSQALKNNSEISFTNANTLRDGLARDANVSAARIRLRDKKNLYELSVGGRTSQIMDPAAEDKIAAGYTGDWSLQKVSGKWTWGLDQSLQTNTWNPDDLGIFTGNNNVNTHIGIYYNEYKPGKLFLQKQTWFNLNINQRYKPFSFADYGINSGFWGKFKNQSWANYWIYTQPSASFDYFEPRYSGKKFKLAPFINNGFNFGSDERKRFQLYMHLGSNFAFWKADKPDSKSFRIGLNPAYRISKKFRLASNVFYNHNNNMYGYAGDTGEDNIIFGRRDRRNLESSLNLRYNFNTKMDLSFRARHYWSKVMYHEYFKLEEDGNLSPQAWSENPNVNINFFNIDLIYTWQFSPGSFLNVIWKNSITRSQNGNDVSIHENYFDNLSQTWNSPQTNSLTVKMIYFLDFNRVRSMFN